VALRTRTEYKFYYTHKGTKASGDQNVSTRSRSPTSKF
jgi:hypothetical protein